MKYLPVKLISSILERSMFSLPEVAETRDLDADTILDYDAQGNVVGITLEHVRSKIGSEHVDFEVVPA
jgi:YD repeat-containing protein